jgi:hypothetical protein
MDDGRCGLYEEGDMSMRAKQSRLALQEYSPFTFLNFK